MLAAVVCSHIYFTIKENLKGPTAQYVPFL